MISQNPVHKQAVDVEVKNLYKKFDDHMVLSDINFRVEPGEIFVIMGKSGAGKSVLLRQIIGLIPPTSGEVLINGRNASDPRTHREIVSGIVFQEGALFNSMSVFDNLALYPREHRLYGKDELQKRINEVLDILSLEGAENKMPSELSGGMRKRVAVARALMMEPQLLLYDEPTSELDPVLGATIAEVIAHVRKLTRLTSIVVSHDRDLAANIADKVAFIQNGRMTVFNSAKEFLECQKADLIDFLNPQIDIENPRFRTSENNT